MGGGGHSVEALLSALRTVDPDDDMGVFAVLWTWLESHLITLGSLEEKPPAIKRAAVKAALARPYDGLEEDDVEWVAEAPLRNAAELLARIGLRYKSRSEGLVDRRRGIDGTEVVVVCRRPVVMPTIEGEKEWEDDGPPTSIEHPTLLALSSNMVVVPLLLNGIELHIQETDGIHWEDVFAPLEPESDERKADEPPKLPEGFAIHLDTLGEHGLSGWNPDPDRGVGLYDPDAVDENVEAWKCAAAAAVESAAGPASILVMPELAASPPVLDAIGTALADQGVDAPLMTIVGAYHRPVNEPPGVEPALLTGASLAEHVNEAEVLSASGERLWCQRKMSCAAGGARDPADRYVENIRLGRRLTLVQSPIGILAVAICLDAFAPHVRERLLRSPAEVLFVPSLSPTVRRHRESIKQLVHVLWGMAFVCNRSPYGEEHPLNRDGRSAWDDDRNRSFFEPVREAAVLEKGPDGQPSFVFRLKGDA